MAASPIFGAKPKGCLELTVKKLHGEFLGAKVHRSEGKMYIIQIYKGGAMDRANEESRNKNPQRWSA